MPEKRISIKGLADYMAASATKQRSILRGFKYPLDDEARAKIIYYREARDRVSILHRAGKDRVWLDGQASDLGLLAAMATGRTKTRLAHNARALRDYSRSFAGRQFEVLAEFRGALAFGDVTITIAPELHVRESGKEKLVKLEFGVEEPNPLEIKVVSQAMFEAAQDAGLTLTSSCILYFDVPRGVEYRGARLGAKLRKDIESACLTMSAVWDSL